MLIAILAAALMESATQAGGGQAAKPPRFINSQDVITLDDYPTQSMSKNEAGITSVLLHVSESGRVARCDVTESSGSVFLDKKTCWLFESRARFEPARDVNGGPIAAEYRTASAWGIGAERPTAVIDVALQTASVPADYRAPVKARLIFGANGRVSDCEVTASSGSAAVDRAACSYTQQLTIGQPKSDALNVPAAGVRYLSASFSTGSIDAPQGQ